MSRRQRRSARRAAAVVPRLRVTAPGWDVVLLDGLVSAYHRTGPQAEPAAVVVDRWQQADQLRDGTTDVCLPRIGHS